MADTDEASIAFAHEAEQAKEKVQLDIDALKTLFLNASNTPTKAVCCRNSSIALRNIASWTIAFSTWLSKTQTSRPSGFLSALLRRQPTHSRTR